MSNEANFQQGPLAIDSLYLNLNEQELKQAEENLSRYLELAVRIYARIKEDPESYRQFKALTQGEASPSMKDKRSNIVT